MWEASGAKGLPVVEDETWEGDVAKADIFTWAGWDDKPDPSKAKKAFLVYNSEEPELKGSYKLPFCVIHDGELKASRSGLRAASSRLMQTDVSKDVLEEARGIIDSYTEEDKSIVKFLDPSGLKIGGYAVIFGGRDLQGDTFLSDTDFWLGDGSKPILYDHGLNTRLGLAVIGKSVLFEVKQDGLWIEAELNKHYSYLEEVRKLIEKGVLGWSTGSAKHLVRYDGHIIKTWPIVEVSLTTTPAEPRTLGVSELRAIAPDLLPQDLSISQPEKPAKEIFMTETLPDNVTNRLDGIEAILKRLLDEPAVRKAGVISETGGTSDKRIKSLADFLIAVRRKDNVRLKSVYGSSWLEDDNASKAMNEDSGVDGGYLVPPDYSAQIMEVAAEVSVVRANGPTVIPIAGRSALVPALDQGQAPPTGGSAFFGGVSVTWTEELQTIAETTPKFRLIELVPHNLAAFTKASNDIIADSAVSLQALLARLFGEAVGWTEDYAFLRGNGIGKPLGVLNAPGAISVTRTAGGNSLEYADVKAMYKRLLPQSFMRAVWVMHPFTVADLMDLQTTNNTMVSWLGNLRDKQPGILMGLPVVLTEKLPAPGSAGDVMLCDFSRYLIGDSTQITIAYSEHAFFTSNAGAWRVTKRTDGQPWMAAAVTLNDGSNTVSPFIYLT